jgi:hypothetical protein
MANTSSGDDFTAAPGGTSETPAPAPEASTAAEETASNFEPIRIEHNVGQTELVIAVVAVVVFAGLLIFAKNAIRRSLIANRATIDTAGAAAWAWYVVILLIFTLVVAGIVAKLFESVAFLVGAAAIIVVGAAIAAMMSSKARRSGR